MAIGFYNFQKLHDEEFQSKIKEIFSGIIAKNAFVEGEYNTKFENDFAKLQAAKRCLLLANGTDALEIALSAYGIGAGDKVGIAAISFFATAECVITVGATPIFIDVDPATGLMDPASLERVLKDHDLKAIIPVHIYGQPAPIEKLEAICHPKGIKIVEDGAQAQGGFYANGNPIGSSKNITTWSFYPTKNLGAFGDAGAITCEDDKLIERILSIRNHGRSPNGHILIGRNSRCDHMQAAVLHLKLEKIEEQNKERKKIAKKYMEALAGLPIRMVPESLLELSSWHLFPIGLATKEQKYALKDHLASKEIGSALFYEKSLPEELPIKDAAGEKKHAIEFAASTLCLPMHPFLTDEDIQTVANELKSFLKA